MGSVGTGSFGDYKPQRDENLCFKKIEDVILEEVARCEYYTNHAEVPPMMQAVAVKTSLYNGRIAVESRDTKDVIGLLPSRFGYLLGCMKQGHSYKGHIVFSVKNPLPKVMVTLNAM
ncbi:hypothetical protein [Aneurinibacillus aneurinilyticus]|uniref:Uncharacterized protein n=1 Tax=Aneurinibacillus aneurinilyticus TaxID=1391 RepID=A0A848D130_ANEAE|nr:hypothetical protein [Aneurinibacillus aneurinilyticus]NMF01139.1 hypothetical protein [Aneurinibacillus aneurinilyticus]